PTGPVAFGLRKLLGGGSIYGAVTRDAQVGAQGSAEMMNIYPRDVLAEARRLQVPIPQLAALAPVFRRTRAGQSVAGAIDFNDIVCGPWISDGASSGAYAMLDRSDPTALRSCAAVSVGRETLRQWTEH